MRSAPCRNQAHHFDQRLLEHHVGGSARVSLNASFTAEPPRRAALGGQTTESLVAWLLELHIDEGCTVVDPQWPTSRRSFHSYTHVHSDTHSQSMSRSFRSCMCKRGLHHETSRVAATPPARRTSSSAPPFFHCSWGSQPPNVLVTTLPTGASASAVRTFSFLAFKM